MSFQFNLIQILVLSAVGNGLVYAILILFKKDNKRANYFLSLLLVSLSLTFTPYLIGAEYFRDFLWLSWLPTSFAYWIGPALFFYIKHLTESDFKFQRKDLKHFTPIILNYFHSIYHGFAIIPRSHAFHVFAELLEFGSLISIFIYSVYSLKKLRIYQKSILNFLSNIERVHLDWLRNFITILASLFLVVFIYFLITTEILNRMPPDKIELYRNCVLVLYALTMYWLSIGGYRQSQTIPGPIIIKQPESSSSTQALRTKVESSKAYLDPELTLRDLSKKIEMPQKEISNIINKELEQNFYQFINDYRIEEVKQKLISKENQHLKIMSIAYESGFNSKATFNRLFKSKVGMTPKEYLERAGNTQVANH